MQQLLVEAGSKKVQVISVLGSFTALLSAYVFTWMFVKDIVAFKRLYKRTK